MERNGLIISTAVVAAVGIGRSFERGGDLAAYRGLVTRNSHPMGVPQALNCSEAQE